MSKLVDHPYKKRGLQGFGLSFILCCTLPEDQHPPAVQVGCRWCSANFDTVDEIHKHARAVHADEYRAVVSRTMPPHPRRALGVRDDA